MKMQDLVLAAPLAQSSGGTGSSSGPALAGDVDVTITSPNTNDVLTYNSAIPGWNNVAPNPLLSSANDIDFTTMQVGYILAAVLSNSKPYSFIPIPTAATLVLCTEANVIIAADLQFYVINSVQQLAVD